MKRSLILLVTLLLILSCGCTGTSGDTEPLISGTDVVTGEPIPEETDAPETNAPETEAPIVLSPEMQEKLGKYIGLFTVLNVSFIVILYLVQVLVA